MRVKVKPINLEKIKLKPHSLGRRRIDELILQMKYYVDFLKKRGIKVKKIQ